MTESKINQPMQEGLPREKAPQHIKLLMKCEHTLTTY